MTKIDKQKEIDAINKEEKLLIDITQKLLKIKRHIKSKSSFPPSLP